MRLPTFKKGIHPDDFKSLTSSKKIEILPLPDEVFIPLQQHIGVPCVAKVEAGQEVKTGQVIGTSEKFVSSPVHASVTGKVKAIGKFAHPIGNSVQMIHIIRSGEDDWEKLPATKDWTKLTVEELRQRIQNAGIVGLGGAAFPTHVKLAPPKEKPIDTFILNGCECEPYLTADHRAMVEQTDKVLLGMKIIMKILGVETGYIGIENNKPDAVEIMQNRVQSNGVQLKVVPLEVKYPQGAEKMLIEAILHKKVPPNGLPMDVGAVVNNIGTAISVAEAITEGKPLIERIVTVTGVGINEPKNVIARIGTPFKNLIDYCEGLTEDSTQVFMGGPMMGFAQHNLNVPIIKATSGIVCENSYTVTEAKDYPCIKCGFCVSVCPVNLLPTRIARLSEMHNWEAADEWGILTCMECGSCAFVCPSNIPLVQWIRIGKLRVGEMKKMSLNNRQ